jgi:hypothetical protein
MPWAERLWIVTCVAHMGDSGAGTGLYYIDESMQLHKHPASVVGTYNRFLHGPRNELLIGPTPSMLKAMFGRSVAGSHIVLPPRCNTSPITKTKPIIWQWNASFSRLIFPRWKCRSCFNTWRNSTSRRYHGG